MMDRIPTVVQGRKIIEDRNLRQENTECLGQT